MTMDKEDLQEHMHASGWSDGLPLVQPTHARIECMLLGTDKPRECVLGECPPMYRKVTVANVALNAVMAGCEPRHFRIVLAAVEGLLSDAFNLHGVHATTMGATPCVIVNGPARIEAGLNSAHGALGSGCRANATIGRALKLVLQNVGGAKLGGTESTTLGSPSKFTLCVAEAEQEVASCGWLPLHQTRGANKGDSVVTVLAVTSGPTQLVDFATRDPLQLAELLSCHLAQAYAPHMPMINEVLLVLSPEHAATLSTLFSSKAQLASALWHLINRESARSLSWTVSLVHPSRAAAFLGAILTLIALAINTIASFLVALSPARLQLQLLPLFSLIHGKFAPKFSSPASFHIVVAGAPAGKFSSYCPGFGLGRPPLPFAHISRPVSVAVDPPPTALAKLADLRSQTRSNPEPELADLIGAAAKQPPLNLSPRKPLEGEVALLDISKNGGKQFLDQVERRLLSAYPHLKCRRFVKPTFSRPCPRALLSQVSRCTAVVAALAD